LIYLWSFGVSAESLFAGQWSGGESNISTLTLKLSQQDKKITGTYCFITQKGNRIDCAEDNEVNLWGTVNNNHADIKFNSTFGGVNGQATLEIKDAKMEWHLTQPPQKGEYYAPENYTLMKEKDNSAAISKKLITDKFIVTLTNKCGDFNTACNDIFYLGIRKSDNSVISLNGKSVTDSSGQVIGAEFANGNVIYKVNYNAPRLTVTQNKKGIINQEGKWVD